MSTQPPPEPAARERLRDAARRQRRGMRTFIADHERAVARALEVGLSAEGARALLARHERQVAHLQAERFAHLLVMLSFAFFSLGGVIAVIVRPGLDTAVFLGLFIVLLVPYLLHYYMLENATQRWYQLGRDLEELAADEGV